MAVVARRSNNDLNTTGVAGYELNRGNAIKNHLRLDYRYSLQPGAYKLTVSLDVYEGTSFPAERKPVFAHLTSNTISFVVR
jgi:hypothetical protein